MFSVKNIWSKFKNRKRYNFDEMPDWMLAMFGSASALEFWYWAKVLSDVGSPYAKAVDKAGMFNAPALTIGIWLILVALQAWFFGNIAARCGSVLKDRHFK